MPEAFRAVAATSVEVNQHGELVISQGESSVLIPLDRLSAFIKTMRKTSHTELEDETPVTITLPVAARPHKNGAA